MPLSFRVVIKPTIEAIRPWILERGLADDEHIDQLLVEAQAWSERPDAFFALTQCAAVGWAP
jgi:hypothetical protein